MWSDTYVFTLNFQDGGGARDISSLVMRQGIQRRRGVWNKLAPTVNTLSFSIRFNATIHNLLMTTTKDILVAVTKNGTAWFTGTVRPNFDVIETSRVGTTKIECVDRGFSLQKKIMTSISWSNYDVSKPSGTATSIVHQLMVAAGFTTADVDASIPAVAKTITNYVVVKGDTTYWDALQQLVFEFGYVFYFQADGKLNLFNFAPASITPAGTMDQTKMEGALRLRRAQREYDGTRVKWWETQTFVGVIVASDRTNATGLYKCMIPLAGSAYYPTGSDTKDVFIDYSYQDYDLVAVVNGRLDSSYETGIVLDTFSDELKRAKLKLHNGDSVPHNITRLDVVGDAICKTTLNWTESPSPLSSDKVMEIETHWITALADAQKLASAVQRYYANVNFVYSAKSKTAFEPGAFLTLSEASWLSISTTVVVTEAIDDPYSEDVTYTLEGMAAYSAGTTSTSSTMDPTPPEEMTVPLDGGAAATATWGSATDGGSSTSIYLTKTVGGFARAVEEALTGVYVEGPVSSTTGISTSDDKGRAVTLGGSAAISVVDPAGNNTHDVPDAALLASSYPMGHLYLHRFDNARYTLLQTLAATVGGWNALSVVTDGISNIKGVRVKVYLFGAGSDATTTYGLISLRPYGSSWGSAESDMSTSDEIQTRANTPVLSGVVRIAILDVPIASGQFEYSLALSHTTTKYLTIQQLGIWV